MNERKFFGKHRGKVENNIDPQGRGRVQVSCAAVLGEGRLSWAMPCTPYGGSGVGFFTVPPIGASVWVEFEGGDPNVPIWSGCFWEQGEAPTDRPLPYVKILKTEGLQIARRTVAKYREELKIPSSSARKQVFR